MQGYYYVNKYEADKEYPIIYRTQDSTEIEKEMLFDVNKMAEGHSYFSIDGFAVSPDNDIIAYFANTTGADVAMLYFKKISTDEILADSLEQASSVVWEQNNTLYYTKQASRTLRTFQVWKHTLFTPQREDVLIYQEDDPEFQVGVGKSLDKNYIFIGSYSSTSSEVRFKKTEEPDDAFRIIHPREPKHKYGISVFENKFYIVSDKNAPDGKVLITSPEAYQLKHWTEIIPHQAGIMIEDFKPLKNYYAIVETENAAERIKIIDLATQKSHYIKFPEEVYSCWILSADDPARDPNLLRVGYSSFTTPTTIYDYDITSKKLTVVKKEHLLGFYTNKIYKSERIFATAKDGKQIPISL
ncbi:MAG: hypothetical protein HC913_14855, partial [Microscillaceae bacterium]|nr:hypothetical protein [Microscillaceae bacterium]